MSKKYQITIKDLAKSLNLHHTTVSRALRNHPDVNNETKRLILEEADKLNYIPNSYATSLRSSKSQTIAILVPNIRHHFFAEVLAVLSDLSFKKGYTLTVYQTMENSGLEAQNLKAILKNRVAGIIASVANVNLNLDEFQQIENYGIPVVLFDRVYKQGNFTKVVINNYKAGFDAVKLLVKTGKSQIGFYRGLPSNYTFDERFRGYIDGLQKNNIPFRESRVFSGGKAAEDGSTIIHQILDSGLKIDSVICSLDQVALGIISTAKEFMINIPDELSVIGFDNHPAGKYISPGLTSFTNPTEELAESCFKKLLSKINEEKIYSNEILLDMKMIKRKSA